MDPARRVAHAGEQAAAADRHDQRVEFGHILDHLQRHRPLPRRDMRMVEGVDEGQAAYGFKLPCMRISVVELLAEQDDRRAVARCLRYLHLRRRLWHRSEEHTSELQSLMRISYAVFCLKKKNK